VAAVGAVVSDELGRVLLIERARDPGRGMLGMPGGFIDPYESAEQALRREAREELGLEIQGVQYLMSASNTYQYHGVVYPVLDVYFSATISSKETIRPEASEVSHWFWTALTDTVLDRMAFLSNRRALEFYREHFSK
jgi:ADP-ribose pyrophosphatase YjhB (NUDIX family)